MHNLSESGAELQQWSRYLWNRGFEMGHHVDPARYEPWRDGMQGILASHAFDV